MPFSRHLTCAVVLLAVLQAGAAAAPITLNFDAVDNTGGTICLPGNELLESGFRIQATNIPHGAVPDSALCAWYRPAPFNPNPTGASLYASYPGSNIKIARADGQAFSLLSIDLADIYNYGVAGNVRFAFHNAYEVSEIVTVSLDLAEGLQTVAFGKANLNSIIIEGLTTPGGVVQLDNVRIDYEASELPEPGTVALLILPMLILSTQTSRRNKRREKSALCAAQRAET